MPTKEENRAYHKKWRDDNREHVRAYAREYQARYRIANREHLLELARVQSKDPDVKLRRTASRRRTTRKLRQAVLDLFGGKCGTCGFDDWRALQIDHIAGGGYQERKRINQYQVSKRVLAHSDEYQLLCANCNWIKRYNNDECNRPGY